MSARHLVRLTTAERMALLSVLVLVVERAAPDAHTAEIHATLARVLKKVSGSPLAKRPKKKRVTAPA